MDDNTTEQTLCLIDRGTQCCLGRILVRRQPAERQIVIVRIELGEKTASDAQIGRSLLDALGSLWPEGYTSAISFPHFHEQCQCAILAEAGFTRTGLFMRNRARGEEGLIAFRPMAPAVLRDYLDAHARRLAQKIAAMSHRDPAVVMQLVLAEHQHWFTSGSRPVDEAISALIDEQTNNVIGTMWTSMHDENGGRTAFIEEFEIDPAARGRGHGERSIKALGNASFGRAVANISLFVQPENTPAYSLYQKLGFAPGRCEYILYPNPNAPAL